MVCSSCGAVVMVTNMNWMCSKEFRLSGRCASCQDAAFSKIYCTICDALTPHSKRPGEDAAVMGCHVCNARVHRQELVGKKPRSLHIVSKCLACNEDYVTRVIDGKTEHIFGPVACVLSELGHIN